jgi:localization factor PodJL
MNSRVPWSSEGIDPAVRERAEAAARRAGMSLSDWLNSTLGDSAPPSFRPSPDQRPAIPVQESRDVANIHQQLDSIARQIEQISQARPRSEARGEAARDEPAVARQLNDAIARLDARLSQISNPAPVRAPQMQERQRPAEMAERAASQVSRPAPPPSPVSLDSAIAEIAARQSELDNALLRQAPPRNAAPPAPTAGPAAANIPPPPAVPSGPDLLSLERHLLKITSQIEALKRPDQVDQSIAAFRSELTEIRHAITEAMPRRAIESIESDIRALALRIDETRQSGSNTQGLAAIERALGEIREALRSLTPAEQLAGYDEAIRNLGAKLDQILRANNDPSTIHQLEGAIAALRAIVSNVASNDALARLSDDVLALSSKVDQLARSDSHADSFAMLEQRIAALTSTLENREQRPVVHENSEHIENALRTMSDRLDRMPVGSANSEGIESALRTMSDRLDRMPAGSANSEGIESALRTMSDRLDRMPAGNANSEGIENALRALADRFDRMPVGNDNAAAFAHLEQRVSYLLERLDASTDSRAGNLLRVEEGLQDILHHLERQHASIAAIAADADKGSESGRPDAGLADLLKRELSDIRFHQVETDRHTQNSLEAVHSTLGHVVDRLAVIEGDLRAAGSQPASPQPESPRKPVYVAAPEAPLEPSYAATPAPASEPAAQPAPSFEEFDHALRAAASDPVFAMPPSLPGVEAPPPAMAPQGRPELPNPAAMQAHFDAAPRDFHAVSTPPAIVTPKAISEILEPLAAPPRAALQPDLPPDHPLEPGTRPSSRTASPSERIAASETAISEIPPAPREPVSTSSFIAAARRAAKAAAASPPPEKTGRGSLKVASGQASAPSRVTSRIRSLLVGASVVVIVLGTFKMAMMLLDTGIAPQTPAMENSAESQSSVRPPADDSANSAMPAQVTPSMTSPTPIGKQSFNSAMPDNEGGASVAIPQGAVAPSDPPANDITGAIPRQQSAPALGGLASIPIPPSERLPDAIGGPVLRTAALNGDPTAAYEIGVRFADGRGIAANFDEAAKWLDRAARAGIVPAIFRLGTLYEKGLAVTKDVDIARRYYLQAAERGNAKAMHNLAVLDADGGGKGANYKSAAQWFRKAADRGVADSQYNLGILYARGIGVEQNLAESFKWFSLAAAQGDVDSGRKRDDIAKRLDAQSLAAATLAIQTFTPEPQPDDAVNVASPAGGWDSAPSQATTAKPAVKPVPSKRTAAAH